jgi:DNA-binding transcriptional regulator LsrR (DeoR family)
VPVIAAALKGEIVDVLICDERTAASALRAIGDGG